MFCNILVNDQNIFLTKEELGTPASTSISYLLRFQEAYLQYLTYQKEKVEIGSPSCDQKMTYGSEARSLTMGLIKRLRVTQRGMERAMLGVSLRDQIRKE
ncbi:jg16391 [Pararge aegeria aegeria]|uniref:Jg16391 protein n=1 Tax=Pararge aegeria aegeria TaxID=348720 RepID=A0A8S4SCZ6_9NEOP|nr:jg16391 [Pararge aegeria aegeria]